MKTNSKEQRVPIHTVKVYTEDQQVFAQNGNQNWHPVNFSWIPQKNDFSRRVHF